MKNQFMRVQVRNMKSTLQSFKMGLQLAALQDDGTVDREEKRDMESLQMATDKFMEELEKVLQE